jgi:hypothetical protein
MTTFGSVLTTFSSSMALIGSGNNKAVTFHAIYTISMILSFLVVYMRWSMQDGKLFTVRISVPVESLVFSY